MTIVVDTNILFSALITPEGRIGEIITYPAATFKIISCNFSFVELFKHQQKITKYSKRPIEELILILENLLRNIEFHNESLIEDKYLRLARDLTIGIDLFDANYVALSLQTEALLWTGDKKLTNHLAGMGFGNVVNTGELYQMLNIG